VIETGREDRPVKIKELWAKRNGEAVLVAVRLDLFTGYVDPLCYVGDRYPQPMDLQRKIPGTSSTAKPSASAPSEEALHRQADAAFAPPAADEALPFADDEGDEDERSVIPMPGASEPEVAAKVAAKPKRSRKERAAKAQPAAKEKPAAKDKPKAKAKA
jgi:hypothetical protein